MSAANQGENDQTGPGKVGVKAPRILRQCFHCLHCVFTSHYGAGRNLDALQTIFVELSPECLVGRAVLSPLRRGEDTAPYLPSRMPLNIRDSDSMHPEAGGRRSQRL